MTDDGDRPVTAAELAAVTGALDEIRTAMEEIRAASTTRERDDARDDLDDANTDLAAAAKRLGISPDALAKAARDAKSAERREELRPIVADLLAEREAERLAAEETPEDDEGAADDKKAKKKPAARIKAVPDAEPDEDTEPKVEHWSERGVGNLIR